MKIKPKQKAFVLLIWLIFPLVINNNLNFSQDQKIRLDNLKESGSYVVSFIHINGNWSATTSYDWCYGEGTWQEPYVIENVTIDASGSPIGYGIYIQDSNVFFIIQNCKIYNSADYGIYLEAVNNSRIINNNCSNNNYAGIAVMYEASNNTISGNIVNDNSDDGIYFYDYCYNNTILGNTVNNNSGVGISIHWYSNNTIITENYANNNGYCGIELYDWCGYNKISNNIITSNQERGIDLEYQSNNNIISDNIINNNGVYGIYLESGCDSNIIMHNTVNNDSYGISIDTICDYNIIKGNTIRDNINYGVYLAGGGEDSYSIYNEFTENILFKNNCGIYIDSDSNNNTSFKNFFVKNQKHAIDDGVDNNWNNTVIGNYWDNYTGTDPDEDGIGNIPYPYISGSAGSIDYLPIVDDGDPRITINLPTGSSSFGSIAPSFNVEINDKYLHEMWYTLDGGLNNYTFRENGTINQIAWDLVPEGNVIIRFYARDMARNQAYEEVSVIKSVSAGGLDPGVIAVIVVISVLGGITIIGAILIILVKRGKISLEKLKSFSIRKK
ncbi:MAG: nitrous oxide reductase family maturation protein NosD [Promethearchaeota archaeon]